MPSHPLYALSSLTYILIFQLLKLYSNLSLLPSINFQLSYMQFSKIKDGGTKRIRTIDLTLIRRAL